MTSTGAILPSKSKPSRLSVGERALPSSMWHVTAGEQVTAPPLYASESVEVLVIGGGFNGLTAALRLGELGVDCLLLEAGEIGEGASGRNAGMVNPGQFIGPDEISTSLGPEHGEAFIKELGDAPNLVRRLILAHDIDCYADYRPVIRAAHDRKAAALLQAQTQLWSERGQPVEMLAGDALAELVGTNRWKSAMLDKRGFTIQPLAYARGLARAAAANGAKLHQHTRVTSLSRRGGYWTASTATGAEVRAKKVILSTNAYTGTLHPAFSQTLVTCGAFGLSTRPLDIGMRSRILPSGHSLYDTHRIPLFLRYDPEGRLMIGSLGSVSDGARAVQGWGRRVLKRLWSELPEPGWSHVWQGTVGLTSHHLPRLISPEEGLIGTIGCNGRGIAANTYFGGMLADIVMERKGPRPLPIETSRPRRFRSLKRESLDLAMRLYRNTALLN